MKDFLDYIMEDPIQLETRIQDMRVEIKELWKKPQEERPAGLTYKLEQAEHQLENIKRFREFIKSIK
jgi:hypothetical protein